MPALPCVAAAKALLALAPRVAWAMPSTEGQRAAPALRAAQGFRDYFAAAEQRWRIGAGSLIDREEARRTALAANNALVNVQRERVAAWVSLYRALGGGWSASQAAPDTAVSLSAPAADPLKSK